MEKLILNITLLLLFFGGIFSFFISFARAFAGQSPQVYGLMGLSSGVLLLASAVVIYIRKAVLVKPPSVPAKLA